jgi:branched-chain amino acid transport system substrate-binding protein
MKKIFILILVALFVLPILRGNANAQSKTLKIGCIGPLSGAAAPWGVQLIRGLQMKVEEVNSAGGLKVGKDTYKIEISNYDTKARADEATQVTKKLVYDDKVKYIIGNAVAATCQAAQLITEPNKVPFIFLCWGIKDLGPDKPYSFREVHGALEVAEPFYEWFNKKFPGIKKVALISPNDTSGWDTATGSKLGAKKVGWQMVEEVYYERGTVDFSPFITKLMAAKPDVIDLCASPPGDSGLIVKGLKEKGYTGRKFCISILDPKSFMSVGGEATDETYVALGWDLEGPQSPPAVKEFAQKYRGKYGEVVSLTGLVNYSAAELFFEAMRRAETVEADKVIKIIETQKFQTIMGPVVIGGEKTYGIKRQVLHTMIVSVMRGGKVVDLEKILSPELR